MKTQISSLINGSENTIRNLSAEKYANNPIGVYDGKGNVPQNGGTPTNERMAIAKAVDDENPTNMHILANGVGLTLGRINSVSGKSWRWETQLTKEQYEEITREKAPEWTHKNAQNEYCLVVNDKCIVSVLASSGKKGVCLILGEEFIEIL